MMRLNRIYPPVGTVIGVDHRVKRFLVVDSVDQYEITTFGEAEPRYINGYGVELRYATDEEITPEAFMHEPRSVAEHRGIRRRMSPYGFIRQYKPSPRKVVKIDVPFQSQGTNRHQRRAIRRIYGRDLNL